MSLQGIPDFGTYKSAGQNLQAFTQLTFLWCPKLRSLSEVSFISENFQVSA